MKKKKNIFIGGGFGESQILWVSRIIKGYSSKPNKIILEKKYNSIIIKDLEKTFPETKIYIENNIVKKNNSFYKYTLIFFFIFQNLNKIFYFFKLLKNRKMNLIVNYENQIINSIWDSSLSLMNDKQLFPNTKQIFISLIKSLYAIKRAEDLTIKNDINVAFLGHSVYEHRALLAVFRKKKIKIFCQAGYNIYDVSKKESAWNQINKKTFFFFKKNLDSKMISNYWNKRMRGKSNYSDANVAGNLKNKIATYPKNVIFLHIFKDSPFNYLDKDRIFYDYFEWVIETLKIIENSNETWSLRIHPNAHRWGENQIFIINKILKNFPNLNRKILIDNAYASNNYIFRNVKRVVTFSGTSHLEASCYKIKPIMISRSTLENIDTKYVLKPKNLNEYKKFLLKDCNSHIFTQKTHVSNISKILLFIRENVLTLISDLNAINTYRNDNKNIINKEFNNIQKSLNSQENYLLELGQNLNKDFTHTFSKKFLKRY